VARSAVVAVLLASFGLPLRAQTTRDDSAWVTRRDAAAFGAAVLATVAIAPFDHPISDEFAEPRWVDRRRVHAIANDVAFFGGDGPFIASAVLFAGTSAGLAPGLRRFAAHNMESIALATIITGVAKGISGRALPGVKTRHAFQLGRGFHDDNGPFVSFPSGHTAAAFAMATTIASEVQRADTSESALVGRLTFGGASAVGIARVIQRKHWPSDLPLAVVIGTWSGHAVQRHSTDANAVGSAMRGVSVGLGADGRTRLGWSSLAAFGGD
jgi:membrane-associated phospholipid phosphatase